MRGIERTGQFKRDYKREAKGRYSSELDAELVPNSDTLQLVRMGSHSELGL